MSDFKIGDRVRILPGVATPFVGMVGTISEIRPHEEFLELASELENVWNSPTADVRLKKRIVRTLIHEIVTDVDAAAGEVILVIHWKGGVHTELRLPRRRRGHSAGHTSKEIVEAVGILAHICSDDMARRRARIVT